MAAKGIYFDRFNVLLGANSILGKPGNIVSVAISRDGGISWVDGFSEDHYSSGTILGNKHTILRISGNLQADSLPVDFSSLDYDSSSYNMTLIAAAGNYASNVYAGGNVYLLTNIAWASDDITASSGINVKEDLVFYVRGDTDWIGGV